MTRNGSGHSCKLDIVGAFRYYRLSLCKTGQNLSELKVSVTGRDIAFAERSLSILYKYVKLPVFFHQCAVRDSDDVLLYIAEKVYFGI